MPFIPRPARPGSTLAALAPRPQPIHPRAAARLMRQAERDSSLDLEGEAIVRALLFQHADWHSGACAPAIEAIATSAKVSPATVSRRLPQLGRYLERVRRKVQVPAEAAAGWRGPQRNCQITNAYYFKLPAIADRPDCESPAAAPKSPKTLNLPLNRARAAGGELEAALAKLGRAMEARPG